MRRLITWSPQVVVAKVDADKHRGLAQRFDVSGFPTLRFFAAGPDKTAETCVAACFVGNRHASAALHARLRLWLHARMSTLLRRTLLYTPT